MGYSHRLRMIAAAGVVAALGGAGLSQAARASASTASTSSSTLSATPSDVAAGSVGNAINLLYTAAASDHGGTLVVKFPAGLSGPQTTNPTGPGYVVASPGSCSSAAVGSVAGAKVSVTLTCAAGQTATLSWNDVTAATRADAYPFAASEQRYPGVARQPLTSPPFTIVDPGPATKLKTSAPTLMQAGCQGAITIWAVDQFKNLATGYTGTVKVTSDDPRAILPAPYTFTAADGGIQTVPIDFRLPNAVTYNVADVSNGVTAASGATSVDSPTLISLAPANGSVPIGATRQLQTTATFADSSTCDISTTALYSSSKPAFATIASTGLASGLGVGTTSITATDGSTVAATNLSVVPAGTTTGVVSDTNPSSFGQLVTFTATVTSATSVAPTGSVTFADGGSTLAVVSLSGAPATATYATSAMTVGSHNITATYAGDSKHTGSSNAVSQVVNQAGSATSVTATGDNVAGHPVTLTALVAAASGSPPTGPTGTVTFSVNGVAVGTATLDGTGTATFPDSGSDFNAAASTYTVTASYGGDGNFNPSGGGTSYTTN